MLFALLLASFFVFALLLALRFAPLFALPLALLFSLLGLRAGGELWVCEEGGDSKRRAPCSRGSDGTYLLGLRAGGELWIYEEGGDNEMPACAACC